MGADERRTTYLVPDVGLATNVVDLFGGRVEFGVANGEDAVRVSFVDVVVRVELFLHQTLARGGEFARRLTRLVGAHLLHETLLCGYECGQAALDERRCSLGVRLDALVSVQLDPARLSHLGRVGGRVGAGEEEGEDGVDDARVDRVEGLPDALAVVLAGEAGRWPAGSALVGLVCCGALARLVVRERQLTLAQADCDGHKGQSCHSDGWLHVVCMCALID